MRNPLAFLVALAVAFPAVSVPVAVDDTGANPRIPAHRLSAPPVIDGVVNPDEYGDAPVISGFHRDLEPARYASIVRVACDDRTMYFAFVCETPNPSDIIANQKRRNGSLSTDDYVAVGIDPRADKQQAWWFRVNPRGTQNEDIPGGAAAKIEWRGDWKAAARVTEKGWSAEMAIPFELLRYPGGQNRFGLTFERHLPAISESHNWPVRTHYYVRDNEAFWEPLQTPTVRRRPLVMPYLLMASGTLDSNAGLDVKYTSENGLTSVATFRPDFQTIEDVVQTIDFSYNPQYLEDRRPFFTEGGDYFGSRYSFYSRSIGEINAGAKSFGRVGPWEYAGMAVDASDNQEAAVLNLAYRPDNRWTLRTGWTGYHRAASTFLSGSGPLRVPSVANNVMNVSAEWWKPLSVNGIYVDVDLYRTTTSGASSGEAIDIDVDRYAADGVLEYHLSYTQVSPDYDARLGYMPEIGYRSTGGWFGESWLVNRRGVRRWRLSADYGYTLKWDGSLYHREASPSAGVTFTNDTGIVLGFSANDRRETPQSPLYRDRIVQGSWNWRQSDIYRHGSLFGRFGRVAGGNYRFVNLSQGLRFTEDLSASLDLGEVHLDGSEKRLKVTRALISVVYDISDERSLAARFIGGRSREDGTRTSLRSLYAAYRQEVRRGADVFIVVGDPNANSIKGQVAMKYVQTF
jgi:hypothetical protein